MSSSIISSTETRNGLVLGSAVCVALLIITAAYYLTRDQILDTEHKQLQTHLAQLLVKDSFDNDPSTDTVLVSDDVLGTNEPMPVYRARANSKPVAAVITAVTPAAYNGPIRYLIGLSYSGEIIALRVTKHNETPGLGDDIEAKRSDWIRSFEQLNPALMAESQWQVKKDGGQFDQFTGATITPRTLVRSVYRVSQWYANNREALFSNSASLIIEGNRIKLME